MLRSANEVMHDVIYAAVVDAIVALKGASGGLPNNLLRDIGAIHVNATFADLPKELQDAINASVRSAFTRLLKEGYSVSNPSASPPRPQPQHSREGSGRPQRRSPPGAPGGSRPDARGPRTPGSARPENRGPRGPGGKPPRGPRPR